MLALQALTPTALVRHIAGLSEAHARKIVSAVHREMPLETASLTIRRSVMDDVREKTACPTLSCVGEQRSLLDPFVKLAFQTGDGHLIESVRIPLEKHGRFSVCVSSQAGCALACTFCATGRLGLLRNLETWEIVEQVRHVRRGLQAERLGRVHGVVFQGMGEPLANIDRVIDAILVMGDPSAMAIDMRAITVCTSGLPSGIRRLAREVPKVRLGISIGSARREVRRSLMPIARAHDLDEVMEACAEHSQMTGLAPMWAVTLLHEVNDSEEDAYALAERACQFANKTGKMPRLSVIPYNTIDLNNDPFSRATEAREAAFREALRSRGVHTHKRYSGGADVQAACGQLSASLRG